MAYDTWREVMIQSSQYEPETYEERVETATNDAHCVARFGYDTLGIGEFATFVKHTTEFEPVLFANWMSPVLARCFKYETSIDFYETAKRGLSRETFETLKPFAIQFHNFLEVFRKAKNPARAGYIYIAEATFKKPIYKIGMSKEPQKRIEKINGYLPITVRMKHKIHTDDMILVEQLLHYQFAEYALQNEWFEPLDRELDALLQIDSFYLYGGKP